MKKLITLTLCLASTSAVFAIPGGAEHTYSFQGARRSAVSHRARVYPAASAWTPPERIPTVKSRTVLREQPRKLGGGFSFSSPNFSNPTFANPTFSNPGFSNPTTANPTFANPSFSNANYSNPSYSSPAVSTPTLPTPSYSNPSF